MKRSNFTFLLFALLSFVSINLGAQSSSCIGEVNISVDAMCGFEVNDAVLGYTGATPAQSIVYAGTGSGTAFPATGSLTGAGGLGLPDGGTVQYQLFAGPGGTGTMLCWGNINLEIKQTPDPVFMVHNVMCSQPLPTLPKVADVAAAANGDCSADITNIAVSSSVSGEACTGFKTIRKITGLADIDGRKSTIVLRVDTINEMPLDLGDVVGPHGMAPGTEFEDAVTLSCSYLDELGFDYPSPEAVYTHVARDLQRSAATQFGSGLSASGLSATDAGILANTYAYPHLIKDTVFVSRAPRTTTTEVRDTTETKINVGTDADPIWVLADVVTKTDRIDTVGYDTTNRIVLIPITKGVVCNFSTKCTDMQFAGCAGPNTKVMRTWQVLDWCSGSVEEFVQWIKLESPAPIITSIQGRTTDTRRAGNFFAVYGSPAVIEVDIAPWTCAAQLALSATGYFGCEAEGSLVWSSSAGVIGSDNVLRNLWLGENAEVCVRAVSDCGSHADVSEVCFTVRPINNIFPVPVAEDQVNVSLTGDPTGTVSDDGGVAKVFVDAIDAGSHNAGCGEVETCLLRKEELENPVLDRFGNQVYVGGQAIYHPAGCDVDGVLPGSPGSKNIPARPAIPYVVCKDFVKFCCSDLGDNLVALVADNGLNQAHSWSVVTVEDKSANIYRCVNLSLDCGDTYTLAQVHPRSTQGTICTDDNLTPTVATDGDACGNQVDVITWRNSAGEVVCQSRVSFTGVSNFNPYEIKWPKHYTGESETGVVRECEPWLDSDGDPVTSRGVALYRIVEYTDDVNMGASFDCAEGEDTGVPVWCQAACALVVANFEPLELEAADACKKIIRRWTVIDWCTWDPNTSNQDDENDSATDSFQAVDDEWLDAFSPDDAGAWYTDYSVRGTQVPNYDEFGRATGGTVTGLPCGTCDKQNEQADHVYFRYTSVDPDGYYTFDQVIKVLDETAPTVTAPETYTVSISGGAQAKGDDFDGCVGSAAITASVSDMCGDTDLSADGAAWWITVLNSSGNVIATRTAFGTTATMSTQNGTQGSAHTIVWTVRDGCGNEGTARTAVSFVDDKLPTPVCFQDLSTAIMPATGTVEIWAADYDNGSFDNCSEVEHWFLLDENGNPTDDQTTGTFSRNLLVTCDMIREFGQGETLVLGLYVSDAQLNIDFCNITLNINGAAENCDLNSTAGFISGTVATNLGDMLESAEVALNVGARDLTEVSGQYMFSGRALNQSYDIKAEKNDDYLNGVSTLDLVLIQKHVLGLQTLDDPYLIIASDINNDGRVTASDLVDLRKLILGVTAELPSNDSWRFVDAAHQFTSPELAFPFPEVVTIDNLSGNMPNQNFVGIKIGDVSGNAIANSLLSSGRSVAGKVALQIEDTRVAAGELVEVSLNSNDFAGIAAYQFTMELNGLEFVGATSGGVEVSEANFAVLDANTVTTAWFSPEGVTASDLFTLTFKATTDVTLSEGLSLSSRVTDAKAYTATSEIMDVVFEYNTAGVAGFVLGQNTPNPFDNVTTIGFELPTAGTATLSVFDVTGKTISVIENTYNAGYNTIELSKSTLGTTGVLYYQLESGDFTATKSMILID